MIKYILCWFPMLIIAIANGSVRDLGYKKLLGELKAHQLSTVTFILLLAGYIAFIINRYPPKSTAHALQVGLIWVVLTLSFEFGFGLMRGTTMSTILHDYDLAAGRIWLLIPIWLFIAPYIFYRLNH